MAMSENDEERKIDVVEDDNVLCAANSYTEKYYLNPKFVRLPEGIKEELQKITVSLAEEAGGISLMRFDADGELMVMSYADEADYYYDDISAKLIIRRIEKENEDLFEGLSQYNRALKEIQ